MAKNRAFLCDAGIMINLRTLGGDHSGACGINDFGQVVGEALDASGQSRASLYESGIMTDLNDLLPPDSVWDYLMEGSDINNSGQVVGSGSVNGQQHALLMTPVPEPSTLALLGIVAVGITVYGWHRWRAEAN